MRNVYILQSGRFTVTGSLILMVLMTLLSGPVSAQSGYKCVDTSGNTTYTELALSGSDCTPMGKTAKSSTDPEAAMQKLRDRVEEVEQTNTAEEEAGSADASRKQNCELARKNQEVLSGPSDVVSTDASGNKTIMSAEERTAALQQAQKDVGYWCDS